MLKAALVLSLVSLLLLAAPAAARNSISTFSGSCTGQEGWATWPEQPMTALPVDMLLRARMSGGECTGRLDGREVEALPAELSARLRGPQSCAVAATSGRFTLKLGGRKIEGDMTYRRVGSRITALWEGDGGGSALVLVHAQVADVAETLRRCAGEGLTRMPIATDQIVTVPSLSG